MQTLPQNERKMSDVLWFSVISSNNSKEVTDLLEINFQKVLNFQKNFLFLFNKTLFTGKIHSLKETKGYYCFHIRNKQKQEHRGN